MQSDDDLIASPAERVPSPVPQTKLKRLKKKASRVSPIAVSEILALTNAGTTLDDNSRMNSIEEETTDSPVLEKVSHAITDATGSVSLLEKKSADPTDLLPDTGDSFELQESEPSRALFEGNTRALDLEEESTFHHFDKPSEGFEGEINGENFELGEKSYGSKVERSKKKRNSLEANEEKRRKKRVKSVGADERSDGSERVKRKHDKARKTYLDTIHVESQRLLRETKDASFKPAAFIQKPISSVLEKIRLRKLEVCKRSSIPDASDPLPGTSTSWKDMSQNFEARHVEDDHQEDEESGNKDGGVQLPKVERTEDAILVNGSGVPKTHLVGSETITANSFPAEKGENECEIPVSASATKQDLSFQSYNSDSEDNLFEDSEKPHDGDDFTPSVLATNLKRTSTPSNDDSSEEENYDKENIEPSPNGGDPTKAFVDDEAEEEDDSDYETVGSVGSEEENENEDLMDLIAPGHGEMPVDCEKRDELHQKWLEQQDAAATDNLLLRLNCGWKQREDQILLCDDEDHEESDVGTMDDIDDLVRKSGPQKNSRELKQMISNMFTEKDDPFLSDEEETDKRLDRQLRIEKTEAEGSFFSPVEDDNSREVFGLIKKLNIAPENNRKRAKTSSFLETLVTGGNSNSSSKSSFLGRGNSNSLPSSNKQGSSTVRSFIFGRDDSNSKSAMSTSEPSLDTKETQPGRNASVKLNSSQSKCSARNVGIETHSSSGPSLIEILRKSSNQSEIQSSRNVIGQSQAMYQFTAFKSSTKKVMRMERLEPASRKLQSPGR